MDTLCENMNSQGLGSRKEASMIETSHGGIPYESTQTYKESLAARPVGLLPSTKAVHFGDQNDTHIASILTRQHKENKLSRQKIEQLSGQLST